MNSKQKRTNSSKFKFKIKLKNPWICIRKKKIRVFIEIISPHILKLNTMNVAIFTNFYYYFSNWNWLSTPTSIKLSFTRFWRATHHLNAKIRARQVLLILFLVIYVFSVFLVISLIIFLWESLIAKLSINRILVLTWWLTFWQSLVSIESYVFEICTLFVIEFEKR